MKTLVLNSAYIPINIVDWKKAVKKVHKERAEAIEIYKKDVPSVIRLLNFLFPPKGRMRKYQPITKRNILLRDKSTCQYCGKHLTMKTMTRDHVYPQDLGGQSTWTNLVASCKKCNNKKANKTLQECGMKLLSKPFAPLLEADKTEHHGFMEKIHSLPHESWRQYIRWTSTEE